MPSTTSKPVPKWYIVNGPRRDGPYDQKQITAFLRNGDLRPCDLAVAVGTAHQKALRDWPEFAPVVQGIAAAAPPPPSPAPAAPTSLPFKVGEQVGLLRKKLPGLKKEAGERLGSLQEKVSGLKKEVVFGRIRRIGKFLFGLVCLLFIEAWAVCLATKDQTVRLATYSVKRFKAWRAGKGKAVEIKDALWPRDRIGWRRVGIGYGALVVLVGIVAFREPGSGVQSRTLGQRSSPSEPSSKARGEKRFPVSWEKMRAQMKGFPESEEGKTDGQKYVLISGKLLVMQNEDESAVDVFFPAIDEGMRTWAAFTTSSIFDGNERVMLQHLLSASLGTERKIGRFKVAFRPSRRSSELVSSLPLNWIRLDFEYADQTASVEHARWVELHADLSDLLHDPRYGRVNRYIDSVVSSQLSHDELETMLRELNTMSNYIGLSGGESLRYAEDAVAKGRDRSLNPVIAIQAMKDSLASVAALHESAYKEWLGTRRADE